MDKINFPFRSSSHLPLLHVIAESGAWEKHGLRVEYDRRIGSGDAQRAVEKGDIEFVGGNHVSPYGARARGDKWLYLGQTINCVPGRKLVVRKDSGINRVEDLRGKKVGTRGAHPRYNDWLQLKQHGLDTDRDEVELIDMLASAATKNLIDPKTPNAEDEGEPLWQMIRDKKIDAAFLSVPMTLFAAEAGLKVIEIAHFPMIYFTTLSTGLPFAEKHPEIVDRFLKGCLEGVHFFKTQPERAAKIIKDKYLNEGVMDDAKAKITHDRIADALDPLLLPTMAAIANVYEQGKRHDKDALKINPMELWDLHFIRRIADSGFVAKLYGTNKK